MKNLLALIGLLVVVGGGVGYYRGWYKIDWSTNSNGKLDVKIEADTYKIKEEVKAGKDEAVKIAENLKKSDSTPDVKLPETGSPATLPGPR